MGVVQIVANRPGAGKTCLISALAGTIIQQGKVPAYCKPFSASPQHDPDVAFLSNSLLPEGAPPVLSPRPLPTSTSDNSVGAAAREMVSGLQTSAETVLVEGPDLTLADGQPWPGASDLAALDGAKVVLLVQYENGLEAGAVADLAGPLRDRLIGVVINSAPVHRRHHIFEQLVLPLRRQGLPVLGAIPEDRFMLAVTVQQILEHLKGTWVQPPEHTDCPVDRFLIGGNIMDSGPNYFDRYSNQAVITRAERPDLQMASLMCRTKCLVLTGGGEPTEYVRVEADKKGVPLISVVGDTMSTAEALNGLLEQANSHSLAKVHRFGQLMQENLDLSTLHAALI